MDTDMKFTFEMNTVVEIDANDLSDILIGAIETGFGWFGWPKNTNGRYINEAFLEDGFIDLPCDSPDGNGVAIRRISIDDLLDGVKKYFESRGIPSWDQYECVMDAGTDDCILQYAVFGEIIYG